MDERMRRLLGVFEENEVVPEGMGARLCGLGEQQAGLGFGGRRGVAGAR